MMTNRFRRDVSKKLRGCRSALALSLALGAGLAQTAQAVSVGHARIVSAAGQPLQLVVPLVGLSPDEAATLVVRLADAAAWRQRGLTPPAPLADMHVAIRSGAVADTRDLIISAPVAPRGEVVDLLLDYKAASAHRRIQVSFVVPNQAAPGAVEFRLPQAGAAQSTGFLIVQRGDTLSAIAQKYHYDGVNLYQMLAALYQINPRAFIQDNMNWVKAGADLAIPDAATVRAIDPAEARRLFLAHSAAFNRYRAGIADTANVAVVEGTPASGRLEESPPSVPEPVVTPGDRVRLSSGTPSDAADLDADEQVALARTEEDIAARIAQLERNIGDITQVLAVGGEEQNAPDILANLEATQAVAHEDAAPIQGATDASTAVEVTTADAAAVAAQSVESEPVAATELAQDAPLQDVAAASSAARVADASALAVAPVGESSAPETLTVASVDPALLAASQTATKSESNAARGQEISPLTLAWWMDNLLVLVTAMLTILVLITAWMMRSAGGRGNAPSVDPDAMMDDDAPAEPSEAMRAKFARDLEGIDLELAEGSDESGHWSRR